MENLMYESICHICDDEFITIIREVCHYIQQRKRILLQTQGTLNGKKGIFEYIIDEAGNVCHQLFKKGEVINGKPN